MTVFDKFGGTRPMAHHLGEAPSTVNDWKNAGRIPATKQPGVLAKAEELGLEITAEDIVFPLGRIVSCGQCGARTDHPSVAACTSPRCPLARGEQEAA